MYRTGLIISFMMLLYGGVLRAQHVDTICAGIAPVWYVVDEQPGSRYAWKAEGGIIIGNGDRSTVTVQWPEEQGLYKLSVTEFNLFGCAGEPVSYYVYVRKKLITVKAPTEACLYTTVKMSINGGMSFRWSNGDTQSSTHIKIMSDTVVTVIVRDTVCSLTIDTFQLPVKALYGPGAHIDSLEGDIYKGQTIEIRSGGKGDVRSVWEVDKGLIRSREAGGVRVNFTDTGKAHVRLFVTNDFGCKDSAEREFHIKGEHVYMPTAFTPDGDGLNDLFRPYGAGIKTWYLEIYNRWGELIFSGNESGEGWNGRFKDIPVPADGYVYVCEGFGYSGKRFALKGTITVLR